MPMDAPAPFDVVAQPDGSKVASNGAAQLIALESDAHVFRRRAVQNFGTENARPVEWAVARVGDVSVYFDGASVVVSRNHDLRP